MKNEITVNPHDLSGKMQNWKFEFRHGSFRDNCTDYNLPPEKRNPMLISISLVGIKEHERPSLKQTIEIGRMSFHVDEKPGIIKLTADMDDSTVQNIVESLLQNGYAKQVGTRTERVQDYPGGEIEKFHYAKLDVTDYYQSYIKEKEKQVSYSPISDIQLVEQYDDPYCLTHKSLDYLTCRMGGLEQERQWVGMDGRAYHRTANLYPECRYQLYELAAKAHNKQMQLYEESCKRVTEYTAYEVRGQFRIRCKIDGVQQMSRQADKEDISAFLAYKDYFSMAAKYYGDVLTEGVKTNISRSR